MVKVMVGLELDRNDSNITAAVVVAVSSVCITYYLIRVRGYPSDPHVFDSISQMD
jgi:hypothetical protein